ncbi:hypothetical protein FB451DRAFT_1320350, partial [Mycena latifolia]
MPVLDLPRLLRPIPYVPETITHLPPYSLEALPAVSIFFFSVLGRFADMTWQVCRCSICERAMVVAQAAQGGNPAAASAPTTMTRASAPEHTHAHKPRADRGAPPRGGQLGRARRGLPAQGRRGRGRGRAGRGDQRAGGVLAADGRAGGPGRVRARDGADRGDARGAARV